MNGCSLIANKSALADFSRYITQLTRSLMYRLSCSMIVAKDGGAPVILDDALGYTDQEPPYWR